MNEGKPKKPVLSLAGGNPNISKQDHNAGENNPLSLIYARSTANGNDDCYEAALEYVKQLDLPQDDLCIAAMQEYLRELIVFDRPDHKDDMKKLERSMKALTTQVGYLQEYGTEFFGYRNVSAEVFTASIMLRMADPDVMSNHPAVMEIYENAEKLWDNYGVGYETADPAAKVVFLCKVQSEISYVNDLIAHDPNNRIPRANRYLLREAPIAQHLSPNTAFEREIMRELYDIHVAVSAAHEKAELIDLDEVRANHPTPHDTPDNIFASDSENLDAHHIDIAPNHLHEHIYFEETPGELDPPQNFPKEPLIGRHRLWLHWAQHDIAVKKEMAMALTLNMLKEMEIPALSDAGMAKAQDILMDYMKMMDFDPKLSIHHHIQNNADLTNNIRDDLKLIKLYGAEYFKDGHIPPTTYSASLMMNFHANYNESLPYAEKKIIHSVERMLDEYGKGFNKAKPQAQLVLLNRLYSNIEEDFDQYSGTDMALETVKEDIRERILTEYYPIINRFKRDTQFERLIKSTIKDLENTIEMSDMPTAVCVDFKTATENMPPKERTPLLPLPQNDDEVLAKTTIPPAPNHDHVEHIREP